MTLSASFKSLLINRRTELALMIVQMQNMHPDFEYEHVTPARLAIDALRDRICSAESLCKSGRAEQAYEHLLGE